jgi:hypothetical protein
MKANNFPDILPYDIIQIGYDKEFRYICNDECEVVNDVLHINEDPTDDIEIKYITEVWREVDNNTMKCIWRRKE